MNQYVKQYQKSSIETASREQILIMLYDGAIQFLNKAKTAMSQNLIEDTHNNLMRAQNIIQEFINSMDREIAPQLAENLISLYEYFIRRLVYANIKGEIEPIDEVISYLKSLKSTWEQAIILAQKEIQNQESDAVQHINVTDSDDENYTNDDEEDDDEEDED